MKKRHLKLLGGATSLFVLLVATVFYLLPRNTASIVSSPAPSSSQPWNNEILRSVKSWDGKIASEWLIPGPFEQGVNAVLAMVNDSVYYYSVDDTYEVFQYDLLTKESQSLGTLDDFVISTDDSVLVDDVLYFPVATSKDGISTNVCLFSINTHTNVLSKCFQTETADLFTSIGRWHGSILLLLHPLGTENEFASSLVSFDPSSNQVKPLFDENELLANNKSLWAFATDESSVYVLSEKAKNDTSSFAIERYNNQLELTASYDVKNDALTGRPLEMYVLENDVLCIGDFNRTLQVMTLGSAAAITQQDAGVTSTRDKQKRCALYYSQERLFYYDSTEKKLLSVPFLPSSNEQVMAVFTDGNKALIQCRRTETVTADDMSYTWYYFDFFQLKEGA